MIGEAKDILNEIFDGSECCLLVRDNAIYVNILLRTGAPISACSDTCGCIDDTCGCIDDTCVCIDDIWIGFKYLGEDYDLNVFRIDDVGIAVDVYYVSLGQTDTSVAHRIPVAAYTRLK